jgi:integrase
MSSLAAPLSDHQGLAKTASSPPRQSATGSTAAYWQPRALSASHAWVRRLAPRCARASGLGELLALRWQDVDFAGHALTISRAISSGVESSTQSGRVRRVPLPDQAAAALDRLSKAR